MKKHVFIILFFICFNSFSQETKKIDINWIEESYALTEDVNINIPHATVEGFHYNELNKTITITNKFLSAGYINEKTIKIVNAIYEDLPYDKLGILNKELIPNTINLTVSNTVARDLIYGVVSFSPIIKEGNFYKKLKSLTFGYDYTNVNIPKYDKKLVNGTSNSVLKTGSWFKFYIQKSGVYILTKSFLSELGFNVNVDPRTIKIYGNGGRMIPLSNSISYPFDLAENAVYIKGEQDGVFNDSDFILFYGEGMDNWSLENETHLNLYSDNAYYYITSSSSNSKRISPIAEPVEPPTITYNNFDDYLFTETDKTNLVRLGRKWVGDAFNIENSKTFNFNFPNIDISSPVKLRVAVAATGVNSKSFIVKANGEVINNISLQGVSSPVFATENFLNSTINATNSAISINLVYNNNGVPSSIGYLDYITLKAKSFLKGYGKQFRFTVDDVASNIGIVNYQINNAAAINQVWDITDIYNITNKENTGLSQFEFKAAMGQTKKYIAVDFNDLYTPLKIPNASVPNQDLKGTVFLNKQGVFQDIDYIIVTPGFLASQAERLANFHRNYSKLNVKVITLDALYEEFGSGKQDIGAIRNFVKYVYDNASEPAKRLKYLCLFGDASFDFKNRIPNNTNIVPIFQSMYSYSISSSFVSDDYFGLMDNNEGNMMSFQGLDVAVGRMICSTTTQAEEMVNKVIDYHDSKSMGKWRNNLVMISDDIDLGRESDASIQKDLNELADNVSIEKPFFNVKKIHEDSYVQETTSGGQKYPKAKEEFLNSFTQGALVFDYFGHGGEDGLSGERLFESSDAINLRNKYKYPLFVTVTCEFTRFDNPYKASAGEYVFWNNAGGSIAMITTTRQIGQSTGSFFNKNLMKKLFSYGSNDYTSIGESVRLTKNVSDYSANNVVSFLGDPALKLAIPKQKVKLTKINGIPTSSITDPIMALSRVTLSGEVTDDFNNVLTNYNGDLSINIYDKEINRTTLGNDGVRINGVLETMPFKTLGETIFRGNASVNNGMFELSFIVPRDIKISTGNGKVSFYATQNGTLNDKTGHDFNIKIGGLNATAVADTKPPMVKLYMNDESFVSGGITNQSPLFLAFLTDEHGINTASGIGHDIVAYIDGDETKPYLLNDYYETELNDFTKGKLKFPFKKLSLGTHTLMLKVWDVYNNITISELQFIVVGDETLTLSNVLNYPNPFVNHTEFWFTHNKPFEPLEVQVQVFTVTGKVVWTKNELITTDSFLSRSITWDGKDDYGDRIGKGVYVYKLTVKSTITNKKAEKFEKLVIL